MKYIIEYKASENSNLTSKLYLYDFGNIKGFLYNNEFVMYKIVNKVDTSEIVELYEGIIPKTVFSIEEYDCNYDSNTYKISNFDI